MARRTNLRRLPRKRRLHDNSVPVPTPDVSITGIGVSTPTTSALITYSGAVQLTGQSSGIVLNALNPTSLTLISPTVVKAATASAATLSGKAYTVPTRDPAVRTLSGGFATAATGTIA